MTIPIAPPAVRVISVMVAARSGVFQVPDLVYWTIHAAPATSSASSTAIPASARVDCFMVAFPSPRKAQHQMKRALDGFHVVFRKLSNQLANLCPGYGSELLDHDFARLFESVLRTGRYAWSEGYREVGLRRKTAGEHGLRAG